MSGTMSEEQEVGLGVWRWRNLRDLGVGLRVWPLSWRVWEFSGGGDRFGAQWLVQIVPLELTLDVNDGSWRKEAANG